MTPAARLAAAIEVLADIEARRRPVADALKDWGLGHRFAGSGDRAAIGNLVYDALRRRASIAWRMGRESPRALVLGTAAWHWDLGADGLAALIAGGPHAPEPLSAEEVRRLAGADLAAAPDWVRADIPEWVAGSFARALGVGWVAEGEALAARPPLDMRVNRLKTNRDKVARTLARAGVEPTRFSPDGLRVPPTTGAGRHPSVQAEPAFQKGWFEIQDEGSQLAALLVGAEPGMQVLDICAGGGGKTLALAAVMDNHGQIFATDADRQRLAPIFDRLSRAGTRNVQVREAGASLDDLAGRLDRVLIDAPCTGSGTWRRRPDAKWRLGQRALQERTAEQAALLADGARYVKPGGRLVYVTCSLLPEENEDRVAAFLAARADFVPVTVEAMIAGTGLPADAAAEFASAVLIPSGGVQMTPLRTGTDAFFVSVLERR